MEKNPEMVNKMSLKLDELEKVSGGVLDPSVQEYIMFIIAVAKQSGESLDSMVAMLRANGNTQEAIDFFVANW